MDEGARCADVWGTVPGGEASKEPSWCVRGAAKSGGGGCRVMDSEPVLGDDVAGLEDLVGP